MIFFFIYLIQYFQIKYVYPFSTYVAVKANDLKCF